ncbi:hypothetical protein PMM47T1_22507 [Pseudomonas sp. M47T1]|nr:hypothetical protein PMM47T1_22507 [Pseudomonas sp. M47T1]
MSGNVLKATVPPVVEPALQYAFLFEFTGRSAVQKITLDFGAKSRIKTFAYWQFEEGGFGQKDIGNGRHTFPVDDDSGRDLKLLLLQVYTAAGEQAFLDNITW